jgi:complex iron-sulfur molybdoenzyme family reductase subunit gamma
MIKKSISIIFIFLFFSVFLEANKLINAVYLPGNISDINTTSKAWLSSDTYKISLYSIDNTIPLKKEIYIKALYSNSNIAILYKFPQDLNNSTQISINRYFIEFPNSAKRLPYVNGGDTNNTVTIAGMEKLHKQLNINCNGNCPDEDNKSIFSLQKSTITNQKDYFAYISNGLQKSPITKDNNQTLKIGSDANKLFFIKSIDANQTDVFLSFGIFSKEDNSSIKYISKWIKIGLKSQNINNINSFNAQIPQNYNLQNGKNIFIQNCIACHRYNNVKIAPPNIAPNLTNIGGWANKEFLKQSILNPAANINPNFKEALKRGDITAMPSFNWLEEKNMNDLLYFLENLKAKDKTQEDANLTSSR